MIFVTVGEQLPFDRLIRAMDKWAAQGEQQVFAQIGRAAYRPQHIEYQEFLEQTEFKSLMQEAQCIVAHAGMGTIISALELAKPIIVMPRKAELGEHRNDHQLATARRFLALEYVTVAADEDELWHKLADIVRRDRREGPKIAQPSPQLIQTIRDFVASS